MFEHRFGVAKALIGALFCLVAASSAVQGAETRKQIAWRVQSTTVTIVAGGLHSTSARLVQDLGIALNDGEKQRILPVLGFGSAQNISDVLYLRGVDAGIVQADVLDAVRRDNFIPDIASKLRYIAELSTENVYIVVRKGINSVTELAGRTVNFGPYAGDGYSTPALMFKRLGINVQGTNLAHAAALEKMATDEISATVVLGNELKLIVANTGAQDNLHLLPLPQSRLAKHYVPSTVTTDDLPGIFRQGTKLDTVAVRLVLVVNNWPTNHYRYKKAARFVETFFSKFKDMQRSPYDAQWKNVKLATSLPDWGRFEASENWLSEHEEEHTVAALKDSFASFLSKSGNTKLESMSEEQQTRMFNEFLAWGQNTSKAKISVRLIKADGVGKKLGTLTLVNTEILVGDRKENALVLQPDLKGLRPGAYAFHVHQNPDCGPKKKDGKIVPGLAAGGHLWLTGTGTLEGQTFGSHLGDLPDFVVDKDGTATTPVVAARLSLADVVNRAVMLHTSNDDTSPRFACAVIK